MFDSFDFRKKMNWSHRIRKSAVCKTEKVQNKPRFAYLDPDTAKMAKIAPTAMVVHTWRQKQQHISSDIEFSSSHRSYKHL